MMDVITHPCHEVNSEIICLGKDMESFYIPQIMCI